MFEKEALSGAKKLCGIGECHAPYLCNHANHEECGWPKIGTEDTCPLAKYNIEPDADPRPWWERKASEMVASDDELFALCANCEYTKVVKDEGLFTVRRLRLEEACLDCPVKATEEARDENGSEC